MQSRSEAARQNASSNEAKVADGTAKAASGDGDLVSRILGWLDDAKAESIVTIDIREKSSIGDYMIVASGRSDRHVGAIAEQVAEKLKDAGYGNIRIEGQKQCDWVLVDAGDIILHVFRPEVRAFYNLEKMWLADRPDEPTAH